ncbi:hypothetical protein JYK14_13770 [Siccirubricoccus sp. KC 17139]|uniref:Uncharacterized protein n=1 Tax=Siccirubricoccus soli TaxID=2899147 RepID=A0ABT1D7S5_9PROT|nr:hypothetical protein [Siccirubricoccus soli]MCO6417224.1 hypothetical protein [Siccirubricoccus soli]MCP2683359.1 hypothetical protein [Siccirubricoccus soli]
MTREEALALYDPIRAGIQRILRLAPQACSKADLSRAVKQILSGAEAVPDDDQVLAMLMDIALFEPNQRGRRAYDGFLAKGAAALPPPDRALAEAMAGARFSLFRAAGRHETAGLWVEDLLAADARLWLLDKSLEASAPEGLAFGLRLFDAGPFHAGFGIIVPVDEETLAFAREAAARGGRLPFRHSLAATLYGDVLRERFPSPADEALMEMLGSLLEGSAKGEGREPAGGGTRQPPAPSASRRRRK